MLWRTGLEAGIEAAIHALCDFFDEHKGTGWGVLLVDACNALSSLKRKAALWNARHLWPRAYRFLLNTYKGSTAVILSSSAMLLYSMKGVTQGDPFVYMAFFVLSVLPLNSIVEGHSPMESGMVGR